MDTNGVLFVQILDLRTNIGLKGKNYSDTNTLAYLSGASVKKSFIRFSLIVSVIILFLCHLKRDNKLEHFTLSGLSSLV